MAENPSFLTLLTSKCASCHSGVYFFDIKLPSNRQKVAHTPGVLYVSISTCASRHNGLHFFDVATSKSGLSMWQFQHVYSTCIQNVLRATTARTFSTSQLPKVAQAYGNLHIFTQNVLRARTACTFSTSQRPKVVRTWWVLYMFTSKCASHHNGVHFFDFSTSKSGLALRCFDTFYSKMCFAPLPRALFRHLNFQKSSEAKVFCTF